MKKRAPPTLVQIKDSTKKPRKKEKEYVSYFERILRFKNKQLC